MIDERWEIPQNWSWVTLGEISTIVSGGTPPAGEESNFDKEGIPWITPADLTGYKDSYVYFGRRSLSIKGYGLSSAKLVPKDTVLLSSRAPIGYCVIAGNNLCTSQGFKNFILKGNISAKYVRYYLISSIAYIESLASGTTFLELSSSKAAKIRIPLPSLEEQKRIVTKIDETLLKSRQARENLFLSQKLITQLKQKVLELVYNGDLSNRWRLKNGKSRVNLTKLDDVVLSFTYGTSSKSSQNGKLPVLRMGNIQDGKLDWEKLVYTSDEKEIKKYILEAGDVLFNRTNSPELVGKTAVYNGEQPAIFAGYLIRIKCSNKLNPSYLSLCLNSPQGKEFCRLVKSDGVSQSNINAKKLAQFNLAVPSIDEQIEIVKKVEMIFSRIDDLTLKISKGIALLNALETALYSKSFSGLLSLGSCRDEPINVLLERIKNEPKFIKLLPDMELIKNKHEDIMIKKNVLEVLEESQDWINSQDVFRLCGININSTTEEIEPIYAELKYLDKEGRLLIEPIRDEEGNKLFDRIKLNTSNASL